MSVKIIVAGSRQFDDKARAYRFIGSVVDELLSRGARKQDIEFVSGHCRGADQIGEQFAREFGYGLKIFPACWEEYGKSAGPIRNEQMARYSSNGILIAFWDGKSKGTMNMIQCAKRHELQIRTLQV